MRKRTGHDDEGFSTLFRAEYPAVKRCVFLLVGESETSEDIAQEAFARLLAHWPKVARYERPEAWVRRVAIRLSIRSLRRRRLLNAALQKAGSGRQPSGWGRAVDFDLIEAVQGLPPRQRAAVALHYLEDRPVAEVADILECSVGTAKVHLYRGRKRLKSLIGEEQDVSQ